MLHLFCAITPIVAVWTGSKPHKIMIEAVMLLHLQGLFSQSGRSIQAVVEQFTAAGLFTTIAADETSSIVAIGLQNLKDVDAPAALLAAHAALEGQVAVFWNFHDEGLLIEIVIRFRPGGSHVGAVGMS